MKRTQIKNNPFQQKVTYKKAFFWNMMGSSINAAASVIMLLITTRIAGEIQGGIFSIGFAIASLMWSIASYETNTFHVTDGKQEFRDEDFLHTKIFLCITVLIVSAIYIVVKQYEIYKASVAFLLCLYKIMDAFSGFFYGAFQKAKRLDLAGKSYFCRVLLSLIGFCVVILCGSNLVWAVGVACFIELVWIAWYEIPMGHWLIQYKACIQWKKIKDILVQCFPLFIASFVLMYINNLPKYTIDSALDEKIQNIFGILFMPASIINLIGIFVFRPLLTTLVQYWNEVQIKKMLGVCARCFFVILGVTVICVIGAYWLGVPLLELLYGVSLTEHRSALVVIMLAGGMSAGISFLYNLLVVTRKQICILFAYFPALLVALWIAKPLIMKYQIMGASLLYLISLSVIFFILLGLVAMIIIKKRNI